MSLSRTGSDDISHLQGNGNTASSEKNTSYIQWRDYIKILILENMQEENDTNGYTFNLNYFDVLFHRVTSSEHLHYTAN